MKIAETLLEKQGIIVTPAIDGKKALEAFQSSPVHLFDAILMDIRMPVMDGLEAASKIRQLDREDAKTVPMIAMTANAYEEDREKSKEAGMNAHLCKPVDPDLLYLTLQNMIR
ncbi:MAG: response regulator [Solobacterium sp.]|nr:response regulator [Solobacterium sp.]